MTERDLRRRARVMRAVNVPMRLVLGMPFPTPPGRALMLLTFTGRKTGRIYRQPVSYARDGDVLLTPGGGRWTLNMTDGRPVRIRVRGRDLTARPELVTDPAEVQRLFGAIVRENPRAARFVPISRGADGRLDPAGLRAAISRGFCIVRWHPAT
jgi:deazaflavin-dependent oxidoreductase (nitroreductase family)